MKYSKPALTFEEQADLLLARGLVANRELLVERLRATNYYRFTSYLFTFRTGDDRYQDGTTLDKVWELYRFDHRLRQLFLDAVETIEVQVRTQLAYHFAHENGAFTYLDETRFPNFDPSRDDYRKWKKKVEEQVFRARDGKGREDFVVHFYHKYGDCHNLPPIWMTVELMDFGSVLSFYRGVAISIRKSVAETVGQPEEVVGSWLLALNSIRNRCAHHARLWNWRLGYPVKVPGKNKFPDWNAPRLRNDRVGIILLICRYWLDRVNPGNEWGQRVETLFRDHPGINVRQMGLEMDWLNHPIWCNRPSR